MRVGFRRDNPGARGGFTLFELLVVMTIIAIAFFAVRPNFVHAVQADRERSALRQVAGMLTCARTEAVARGRLVQVTVSTSDLQAGIQVLPDLTATAAASSLTHATLDSSASDYRTQFDPLPLLGHKQLHLPDSLQISELAIAGMPATNAAEQVIYFYPDGHTSGAALMLTGARGQYEVDLSATTGKVSVNV